MKKLQTDPAGAEEPAAIDRASTLAVMQPYFFPYIGYYQLMAASDLFVTLDDVSYIKQGWINRNRLLAQGRATWFTAPVSGAGSHVRIADVLVNRLRYAHWRTKFLKLLRQDYGSAPFYGAAMETVVRVLPVSPPAEMSIAALATRSLATVMEYLDWPARMVSSSTVPNPGALRGVERVLDICAQFGSARYVNAPGGTALYDPRVFRARGVDLAFLQPGEPALAASRSPDGGQLSMLHLLMLQPPASLRALLQQRTIE